MPKKMESKKIMSSQYRLKNQNGLFIFPDRFFGPRTVNINF